MIAIDDKIILSDREMPIIYFAVVVRRWIDCTSCRAIIDCRAMRGSFCFFSTCRFFFPSLRGGVLSCELGLSW